MYRSLLAFVLFALLVSLGVPHACVHDSVSRNITKVRAPATDGAPMRRAEVANAAPIRIVPQYHASNNGTDISTEVGMSPARKAVVEAAMNSALARFSALLRVTPTSGNLFAYRECTEPWPNGNCKTVNTAPTCGYFSLSDSDMLGMQVFYPSNSSTSSSIAATGSGVPNADVVILVTALSNDCKASTLAFASHCQLASNDRPTFGFINFCPSQIPTSVSAADYADFLSTVLHELTHVLVFSSTLFPLFRDDAGQARTPRNLLGKPANAYTSTFVCPDSVSVASPSTISYSSERDMSCSWGSATTWATANIPYGSSGKMPNDCVARISTPRVASAAQEFFDCNTLNGAELESQDTSECFVQGSHWDARSLASELMAAYSYNLYTGSKISPITLAVFEDSGWYTVAYEFGDRWIAGKDWGFKQGCAFATQKCTASNAGSPPHFFFGASLGDESLCTVERRFKGKVTTQAYASALPVQFRYFSMSTWGGSSDVHDYCPSVNPVTDLDCTSISMPAVSERGEIAGVNSLCHMSTLRAVGFSSSPI